MKKTVILAYPGTGKTKLCEIYDNIIDFEHQDYKWIYDESIRNLPLDQRKGRVDLRKENPDFPKNFLDDAIKLLNKGNIVVSPFIETVFNAFNSTYFKSKIEDARIILACPNQDAFNQYIEKYRQRGNGEQFISRRIKEFPGMIDLFNRADGYEKILLKPGEFLSNALREYGLDL